MTNFSPDVLSRLKTLPDRWDTLSAEMQQELLKALQAAAFDENGFPLHYRNRDTGKFYKPHNAAERLAVYTDTPRYTLLKGGEGCVAAETLIEGVPAAEWQGGMVRTLFGNAVSGRAFCKGYSDLYRLETESGLAVEATLDHQMLTPWGWRHLRNLCVGDYVACSGIESDFQRKGTSTNFLDCCSLGFHHDGELVHLIATIYPNIMLQPHELGGKQPDFEVCFCDTFLRSTEDYSCPLIQDGLNEFLLHVTNCRQLLDTHRNDLRRLEHAIPLRVPLEVRLEEFFLPLCSKLCETYLNLLLRSIRITNSNTNSTFWQKINSVTFTRHGEFYDLTVPFAEHYVANGLIHHNSGKTVAGSSKTLSRLRRNMNGLLLSPSLPHLKRSAWSEFVRWCPPEAVIEKHRERLDSAWEPREPFRIVFRNGAILEVAGIVNPGSLEGPNLNFVWFDEARHFPDSTAIKVLDGRVRIPGPNGEMPQMFLTTTPKMNWLFDYFGPMRVECPTHGEITIDNSIKGNNVDVLPEFRPICPMCLQECKVTDEFAAFKKDSLVVTLSTAENVANLQSDFVEKRAQSLTEVEARVLLDAEWEDIEAGQPFLPTMLWWDSAATEVPQLDKNQPMVVALDAATGRTASESDCFAILGVTRHWDETKADTDLAVRFYKTWRAKAGHKIDFEGTEEDPGPERVLRWLCENYNVLMVTYDPTELHSLAQRLSRESVAWFKEFSQQNLRYEADRQLLNLIQAQRIAHDGSQELREHLRNADRKLDPSGKKLRIVKRSSNRVVDLAICLSMAAFGCLRLALA